MPLPSSYADQNCSVARALEIVGERWTLLIIRDAFYGVRSFGDFASQLGIPRAVLTTRLNLLVEEGVLTRGDGYELTAKGLALWPVLRSLLAWGDQYYSPNGIRRLVLHDRDGAPLGEDGRCSRCGRPVPVDEIRLEPGPGSRAVPGRPDPVSDAINTPRRLLEPIRHPRGD